MPSTPPSVELMIWRPAELPAAESTFLNTCTPMAPATAAAPAIAPPCNRAARAVERQGAWASAGLPATVASVRAASFS